MSDPVAVPSAVAPAATEPALHAHGAVSALRAGGRTARVAVLGASGYSGQELTRLAIGHPGLELVALSSREHVGRSVSEILPGLDPRVAALPEVVSPERVGELLADGLFDTLVSCLPHGAWRELAEKHPALAGDAGVVVDLSSDHRDGAGGWVYGLPEANRVQIADATRIANPGCYPTAATLALLPALAQGWIAGPVMVNALSGVSGAGRSASLRTSFVELDGGASLYKVGTVHQHVSEMERTFATLAGAPVQVGFAPQLAPMARGILLTAHAPLQFAVSPDEARRVWAEHYAGESFIQVLDADQWPETRAVRGSNRCDIAVTTMHGGQTLLVTAALDNLVKGASGQAIQNLNLVLGWPENWGLPVHGSPW